MALFLPQIEYSPGAEMAGATPAFVPAVLTFVEVMRRWQEGGITVPAAHAHVVRLRCSSVTVAADEYRLTHATGLGGATCALVAVVAVDTA